MLTQEELDRFQKDGFLVGPAIRNAEAMDRTRQAIDAVLGSNGFADDPTAHRHLDARIGHDLCADPAIVERAAAILGPDLLLWHSRFFDKPPGAGPVPWHQDKPFWPIEPDVCLSVSRFPQLGAQVIRGEDRFGLNRIVPAP